MGRLGNFPWQRVLLLVGLLSGATACGSAQEASPDASVAPDSTPTATLTVSVTPSGSGHVASATAGIDCGTSCAITVDVGTSVTLNAAAYAGSELAGWSGGGCFGGDSCVVVVDADMTVDVAFDRLHHVLTANAIGGGDVVSNVPGIDCGAGADCSEAYEYGTEVTLTAMPAEGATFAGWFGACTGTGTCTVTMTDAADVSAQFVCPGSPTPGSITLDYTGTKQFVRLPCTVRSVDVDVYGGSGGISFRHGAFIGTPAGGGRAQGTLALGPAQVMVVVVGGEGNDSLGPPGANAYNGGAGGGLAIDPFGNIAGGGGGGASDIRLGGQSLDHRVVVAGGAGGTTNCFGADFVGGVGGGVFGGAPPDVCQPEYVLPGGGGQAVGGPGGFAAGCGASDGTLGDGALGCDGAASGGGGGGYYGGGGGAWSGGAGGSSYTDPTLVTNVFHTQGANFGPGQVVISW